MNEKRERIDIDVYYDETGRTLYRLITHGKAEMPGACSTSGFFIYEDDLDEWLLENKSRVVVVTDFRK